MSTEYLTLLQKVFAFHIQLCLYNTSLCYPHFYMLHIVYMYMYMEFCLTTVKFLPNLYMWDIVQYNVHMYGTSVNTCINTYKMLREGIWIIVLDTYTHPL